MPIEDYLVEKSVKLPAKEAKPVSEEAQPRIYADEAEKMAMKENNPTAIQVLEEFLKELPDH